VVVAIAIAVYETSLVMGGRRRGVLELVRTRARRVSKIRSISNCVPTATHQKGSGFIFDLGLVWLCVPSTYSPWSVGKRMLILLCRSFIDTSGGDLAGML